MKELEKGLIVSCISKQGDPLYSSYITSKIATAAYLGGCIAIRAQGISDIRAIKQEIVIPIIGVIKEFKDVDSYISEGVEFIEVPMDLKLMNAIQSLYPELPIIVAINDLKDIKSLDDLNISYISTSSLKENIFDNDYKIIKELISTHKSIIASGDIMTPEQGKTLMDLGCTNIIVGSMITKPREITKKFVDILK